MPTPKTPAVDNIAPQIPSAAPIPNADPTDQDPVNEIRLRFMAGAFVDVIGLALSLRRGMFTDPAVWAQVLGWLGHARAHIGDVAGAIDSYSEVLGIPGGGNRPDLRIAECRALLSLGLLYERLGDVSAAASYYRQATLANPYCDDSLPDDQRRRLEIPEIMALVAAATARLAALHGVPGYVVSAREHPMGEACEGEDPQVQAAQKLLQRALLYHQQRMGARSQEDWSALQEAEMALYNSLFECYGDRQEFDFRRLVARAVINSATLYGMNPEEHQDQEIACFDLLIDRYSHDAQQEITALVCRALVNKGLRQSYLGDPKAALETFDRVVSRYTLPPVPEDARQDPPSTVADAKSRRDRYLQPAAAPEVQVAVARALLATSASHAELNELPAARASLTAVVERFGDSLDPELQYQVTRARFELAALAAAA